MTNETFSLEDIKVHHLPEETIQIGQKTYHIRLNEITNKKNNDKSYVALVLLREKGYTKEEALIKIKDIIEKYHAYKYKW